MLWALRETQKTACTAPALQGLATQHVSWACRPGGQPPGKPSSVTVKSGAAPAGWASGQRANLGPDHLFFGCPTRASSPETNVYSSPSSIPTSEAGQAKRWTLSVNWTEGDSNTRICQKMALQGSVCLKDSTQRGLSQCLLPNFIFCRLRPLPHLQTRPREDSERLGNEVSACKGVSGDRTRERALDREPGVLVPVRPWTPRPQRPRPKK